MKKTVYFCDYCGKRCDKLFNVNTVWEKVFFFLSVGQGNVESIQGEGCKDCYKSFQQWKKSRRVLR